jgi:hypothetical protein
LLALRKDINDFDLVGDPIATGQQAAAIGGILLSRTRHGYLCRCTEVLLFSCETQFIDRSLSR